MNEKRTLKCIIQKGRASNTEIANDLNLSPQAVGKIRDKLEKKGIIKGYTAIIDYEKIGVNVIGIAFFRFRSGAWGNFEDEDIKERLKGPHLIKVFRFSEGEITHMVIYGFRNLKESDNYFHKLQTDRGHLSELKKLYVFSSSSIMKDTPNELLEKVIEEYDQEKPAKPEPPLEHEW